MALLLFGGCPFFLIGATILCVRRWGWWRLLALPFLLVAFATWGWLVWWDYDERVNGNIQMIPVTHSVRWEQF